MYADPTSRLAPKMQRGPAALAGRPHSDLAGVSGEFHLRSLQIESPNKRSVDCKVRSTYLSQIVSPQGWELDTLGIGSAGAT